MFSTLHIVSMHSSECFACYTLVGSLYKSSFPPSTNQTSLSHYHLSNTNLSPTPRLIALCVPLLLHHHPAPPLLHHHPANTHPLSRYPTITRPDPTFAPSPTRSHPSPTPSDWAAPRCDHRPRVAAGAWGRPGAAAPPTECEAWGGLPH